MRRTRRYAVNLWTAGFVSSALIQGVGPRWFARGTSWGYNQGWQRRRGGRDVGAGPSAAGTGTLRYEAALEGRQG